VATYVEGVYKGNNMFQNMIEIAIVNKCDVKFEITQGNVKNSSFIGLLKRITFHGDQDFITEQVFCDNNKNQKNLFVLKKFDTENYKSEDRQMKFNCFSYKLNNRNY